jgi:hypothetical protein
LFSGFGTVACVSEGQRAIREAKRRVRRGKLVHTVHIPAGLQRCDVPPEEIGNTILQARSARWQPAHETWKTIGDPDETGFVLVVTFTLVDDEVKAVTVFYER